MFLVFHSGKEGKVNSIKIEDAYQEIMGRTRKKIPPIPGLRITVEVWQKGLPNTWQKMFNVEG